MPDSVDALLMMGINQRLVIPVHAVEAAAPEIFCLFGILFTTTQNVTLKAIGLNCVHWIKGTLAKLLRIGKSLRRIVGDDSTLEF